LSHSQYDGSRAASGRSATKIRLYSIALAIVLCLQSIWILTPELIRQSLPYFPTDRTEINDFSEARKANATAANVAWIRGDLWVDFALAASAPLLNGISNSADDTVTADREIAEHAAALAPYDARVWLLLSGLNFASDSKNTNAVAQLKMSFYTAPNDIRLIPLRLSLAARLDSIDDEVQNLIEHDVRTGVRGKPSLNSGILAAYNNGSPAGRGFIETKLAEIDPQFLAELRNSFK